MNSPNESSANTLEYGYWPSPVSSDILARHCLRFGQLAVENDRIYWNESRPTEGGRMAVVCRFPDGTEQTLLNAPFQARSDVHEYGGGEFSVRDGRLFFVNADDQQLYRRERNGEVFQISRQPESRYAEPVYDPARNRLIAVCERHLPPPASPVNYLVAISLDDGEEQILAEGHDFYSSPVLSPDGVAIAWLCWKHPNMPWDGCELWCGYLGPAGHLGDQRLVDGGAEVSIFQPEWSPSGELHWVSDATGWWNLYRERQGKIEPLWTIEAEFARPQWSLGMSSYGFDASGHIVCSYCQRGEWHLARLDPESGRRQTFDLPYRDFNALQMIGNDAVLIAGAPDQAHAVVKVGLEPLDCQPLRCTLDTQIEPGYLSIPESISFPGCDGERAYGFFYRPSHPEFSSHANKLPPLLVMVHGGPTGATTSTLKYSIQFWTSRGFAVLDVNYGGSTGYGRQYRQRLRERWGIVDSQDAVCGARFLVERGEVDASRMAIRGGSAGGFTTLSALIQFDDFKAGASHYGIADLESLVHETHKFESHDLEKLIGAYPTERQRYIERSPIHALDRLNKPLILFQGLEDKVVPPSQSSRMYEAVLVRDVPVAYFPFAGESHGFRRPETIKKVVEEELAFYKRVLL